MGQGPGTPPFYGALRQAKSPSTERKGLGGGLGRPGETGVEAHALISSCRWILSLQRSRYLDWVALYSVITSTNFRESVECWGGGTHIRRQEAETKGSR